MGLTFDEISASLTIYTAIVILVTIITTLFSFLAYLKVFYRKERMLFKNLKRPIMIFSSTHKTMELETKLLKDSKLFNLPEDPSSDYRNIDRIDNHGIIIIGYSKGMANLNKIVMGAQRGKIPVIIYASHKDIDNSDMKMIEGYTYNSICNTPLRLINDVFTILSTFPHK